VTTGTQGTFRDFVTMAVAFFSYSEPMLAALAHEA
jgi:hypothetical protein